MSKSQVAQTARRYSPEFKERAVRMVAQLRAETGQSHGTIKRVADQLGCGVESLRSWVNQAEVDAGAAPGTTTVEADRVKALEAENRELRRANAILRSASAFFAVVLDRPLAADPQIIDCAHHTRERIRPMALTPCRIAGFAGADLERGPISDGHLRWPGPRHHQVVTGFDAIGPREVRNVSSKSSLSAAFPTLPRGTHAPGHCPFVHIEPCDSIDQHFHRDHPLRAR